MARTPRAALAAIATAAAVSVVPISAAVQPQTASATVSVSRIVVLGDSYSANPTPATKSGCRRSTDAWPYQLKLGSRRTIGERVGAEDPNLRFSFLACTGATMKNLTTKKRYGEKPQIGRIPRDTTLIYLTIGGNDLGFTDIVRECALGACTKDSLYVESAYTVLNRGIFTGNLVDVLKKIKARAPQARVKLVGYPELFNADRCGPIVWGTSLGITRDEASLLSSLASAVNRAQRSAASKVGAGFISVLAPFEGHGDCTDGDAQWIYSMLEGTVDLRKGVWKPATYALHPNAEGRRQYARIVDAAS